MIRAFATIFALCLACSSSHAQSVTVRSGDHSNFTRLTFELDNVPIPSVTRTGKDATLFFAADRTEFNLSNAFRRISRNRVGRISTRDQSIEIQVVCVCSINTFSQDAGTLFVVDILDLVSEDTNSIEPNQNEASAAVLPLFSAGWNIVQSSAGRTFGDSLWPQTESPVFALPSPKIPPREFGQPDLDGRFQQSASMSETAASIPQVQANENRLFADAPFQHYNPPIDLQPPLRLHSEFGGLPSALLSRRSESSESDNARNLNIRFRDPNANSTDQQQRDCYSENLFAMNSWFPSRDFPSLLSNIHHTMANDLADNDNTAKLDLLKLYLRFGLLAEAEQVSQSIRNPDTETKAHITMLRSLHNADRTERLVDFSDTCSEQERFWSILSTGSTTTKGDFSELMYLQQVQQLPKEIRRQVLSRISKLSSGGADASVFSESNPIKSAPSTEIKPHHKNTALSDDVRKASEDIYVSEDDLNSPLRMIKVVKESWRRNLPVDQSVVESLEYFGFVLRGTTLATQIDLALFRSHLVNGSFERSFDIATREELKPHDGLTHDFYVFLAENGSDTDLVKFAFRDQADIARSTSDELDRSMSDRLSGLGW